MAAFEKKMRLGRTWLIALPFFLLAAWWFGRYHAIPDAFSAGHGFEWMTEMLPLAIVVVAFIVYAFYRDRTRPAGEGSYASSLRTGLTALLVYFAPCVGAGLLVRFFMPLSVASVYTACYWALTGLALLGLLWFFTSKRSATDTQGAKITTGSLIVLAGLASAPIFWLQSTVHAFYSPSLAVVGLILVAPPLLWESGLFSIGKQQKSKLGESVSPNEAFASRSKSTKARRGLG